MSTSLQSVDPDIHHLIEAEKLRQHNKIRLIASENYASKAVLAATGSVLTNKYSEGYAGKRYYQGQEVIDAVEQLACERLKTLFGADHVNVQPYSGSPANLAVYMALCKPGDSIMGQALPMGGHLSHGWKVNFSGILFDAHQYPVDRDTERLNFAEIRKMAIEVKPTLIFAGHSAYPRELDFNAFAEIADEVGAFLVADIAHISGLVAAGLHQTPVPVADVISSTTHKTFRGPRGGMLMCKAKHKKAIDRAVFPCLQGGPHNHVTAAIAVAAKEALQPEFKTYCANIIANAKALGEGLKAHGLRLVTGGTDNHLLLVDLRPLGLKANAAAAALNAAGIVCNSNTIPYDPATPFNPSGLRLGTPALTSRGMGESEMKQVADWMAAVMKDIDDEAQIDSVAEAVSELLAGFPAPGLEDV